MSVQLIQQAICYMEEHICEPINYVEVAGQVHMSGYHFHRTFSFITGMTANEYIRKRRLTLAAIELQTTDSSVTDVAYKYGYESPESFSKAFSRFHGSTPKQAKRKGAKLHLFNPLAIKITAVLLHPIVPTGCEMFREYLNLGEELWDWNHILEPVSFYIADTNSHKLKFLEPRVDFFKKHDCQLPKA